MHGSRRAMGMALCLFAASLPALAADLTISNFRVRGPAGGNDEFVELHNGSGAPLAVGGYALLASNASGTTGTRATLPAGTTIAPGCYLLLTNRRYDVITAEVILPIHAGSVNLYSA